jgi:actin-like ATPase involved in cell morphogenesis
MSRISKWISSALPGSAGLPWCIELGSAMTRIGKGHSVLIHQPTCVVMRDNEVLVVGEKAAQWPQVSSHEVEISRPIRFGQVQERAACSLLVRSWMSELSPASGVSVEAFWAAVGTLSKVWLVVPSSTTPLQRKIWQEVGATAGNWVGIMTKAQAYAVHWKNEAHAHPLVVIDLGAQTLEVALLHRGEVLHEWSGEQPLDQLRSAVANWILEKTKGEVSPAILDALVEELRCRPQLSGEEKIRVVRARERASGLPTTISLQVSELSGLAAPWREWFVTTLTTLLQQHAQLHRMEQVTVILTGGSPHLATFAQWVQEQLHVPLSFSKTGGTDCITGALEAVAAKK